jgi:cephalosporin-C deacetylase
MRIFHGVENAAKFSFLLIAILILSAVAPAQPPERPVRVIVSPNHTDWNYSRGQEAIFTISVLRHNIFLDNLEISYEYGPETLTPTFIGTDKLKTGKLSVNAGTLNEPGFLRLTARVVIDGETYEGMCTAAFDHQDIRPYVTIPDDFSDFWQNEIRKNSLIPLDPLMELQPELCTDKVKVYYVSFQNVREGARIYGWLALPAKKGSYPAILRVPGAGVRKYAPDISLAEQGFIVLVIGIHGIPLTADVAFYDMMRNTALWGYPFFGSDDRDRYYYKRVYLGCIKAIDFLTTTENFDGKNIGVMGGSQGGALAMVTAALDKRITAYVSNYPALCDLPAYLHNRAGGWPHMFRNADPGSDQTRIRKEVTAYYDVVNFARLITVPGMFTWGYNDVTCPPTSFYAAYNVINAPRQALVFPETGHWTFPAQTESVTRWLAEQLKRSDALKK